MAERVIIVIPARYGSSRFPGKPMAQIAGVSMLERVWRIAKASKLAERVVIATDDHRLRSFAASFGAEALMTSTVCRSGTDRVAEVAGRFAGCEIFFNLQGDAVLTPPWIIDDVIHEMITRPEIVLATAAQRLDGPDLSCFLGRKEVGNTTGTLVVSSLAGEALYFSRSIIPCSRDGRATVLHRHIGLYSYRRDTLLKLADLPESPLEMVEKLEQLRALENGIPIRVVEVDCRGRTHASIDAPEDVAIAEDIILREGELPGIF